MDQFEFSRATTLPQAIQSGAKSSTSQQGAEVRFVAGGTNLIDMMKLYVERPRQVVDINSLPLDQIEQASGGGLKIGALTRNADVAHHPVVMRDYAVLSQALLSGASPQLRNMATTSGNLLQRTRCVYFRDTAHACNKREPGTGCSAIDGHNRMLAILGTSSAGADGRPACIATNPSDQNVALTALEATIQIQGAGTGGRPAERSIPIHDFYLVPGTTPNRENILEPGDLITSVTLPPVPAGTKSLYLKLRDRAAYEFALASAAVVVRMDGKKIANIRIALGGVGTKPWRALEAEKALHGATVQAATFRHAAEEALRHAKPQSENGYKVELTKRCLTRALTLATTTV